MGFGMRMRALVTVIGLLLATLAVDALAASQVRSVRLWRAPDNTRLVFDLSGPVQHSVFTLQSPDRLVIDINGATLGGPLNVPTANTPITSMRSAQRTPDDLRVVIDLKKAVTPKSFTLAPNQQYGNRLVVDLYDNAADANPTPSVASQVIPFGPETLTSYEVGLRTQWFGRRLRINPTYYFNDYRGLQRSAPVTDPTGAPFSSVFGKGFPKTSSLRPRSK